MSPRVNVTVTVPMKDTDPESPNLWTEAVIDVTVEHPTLTAAQLVNAAASAADRGCAALRLDDPKPVPLEPTKVDF